MSSLRALLLYAPILLLLVPSAHCQGRRLFISIGSDDWGRWSNSLPVWPDMESRKSAMMNLGWPSGGEPMLSTVEEEEDLQDLHEMLSELNRNVERRLQVVLTPFWVVGGPDFEGMRRTGCPDMPTCEYRELFWHNSTGGHARSPYNRGDLRSSFLRLFLDGLWHPEYHGRSHFDTRAWVQYLREGDKFSRFYFEQGMVFYDLSPRREGGGNSSHSLHCEYMADDVRFQKSEEELGEWVREGMESFRSFWGYRSRVTSVPTHHAPSSVGAILAEEGILAVEGNELDFVDTIEREEVDLDSWWQLGGAEAVKRKGEEIRARLRRVLEERDFVSLQWHAQNAMSKTYPEEARLLLRGELVKTVEFIRREFPETVFVTAGELAELKMRGWSTECWHRKVLLRNYLPHSLTWRVPKLSSLCADQFGAEEEGLVLESVAGPNPPLRKTVREGEVVELIPDAEYVLMAAAAEEEQEKEQEDPGARGLTSAAVEQEDEGGREEAAKEEEEENGEGEIDEATALYYSKIYGDSRHVQLLLMEKKTSDVIELGRALKRLVDKDQREALKEACRRCRSCRTCRGKTLGDLNAEELQEVDPLSLPPLYTSELFEEGAWQDRVARRANATVEEVEIIFLSPRFGDVLREPATIEVLINGYDFDSQGGYAVLAAGGQQVLAWQGSMLQTVLFGTRNHVPQLLLVALMNKEGRPLGVTNSLVYWETDLPSPPSPLPKSTVNASSHHSPPWRAGDPFPPQRAGRVSAPNVRAPEGRRVALVITSCVAVDGRLTLLEETVVSFLHANTYPIDRYILIDDSGDEVVHARLLALFGDLFHVLLNRRGRTGMTFSIDSAYGIAEVDYIFHCQDDWLFHSKGDFVRQSIEILEHDPDIFVVWCRDHRDHDLPLGFLQHTASGVPYRQVLPLHRWKGFTFNPGLRRKSDYEAMAPIQRYWFEDYVQGYMRWMGQYGASLVEGWTRHTGEHHSTKPSYQAANEELARNKMKKNPSST